MRVVHLGIGDDLPGAARASYRLHRELCALGTDSRMVVARKQTDDPTVVGPATPLERARAWAAAALEDRLRRQVLRDRNEASLGVLGSGLLPRVQQLRPDVVTLHWIAGGVVSPPSLRHLRTPVVWRLADMWPFSGTHHYAPEDDAFPTGYAGTRGLDRWVWRRKRRGTRGLDLTVVAPSRWMARCAERSAVFAGRRIEVIATGTDLTTYRPQDQAAARAALGLPGNARLVLFGAVGSDSNPRKGARELRAALAHVSATTSDPPELVVFGGGGEDLRRTGLRVHALGTLQDEERIALAYAAADVFVAPSLRENLANTVLESLACGTPVVAFDVGGMPDAIDHASTGWLAPPADVAVLAAGVLDLIGRDAAARARMRAAARAAAERRFDGARQAAAWSRLYDELVAPENAASRR